MFTLPTSGVSDPPAPNEGPGDPSGENVAPAGAGLRVGPVCHVPDIRDLHTHVGSLFRCVRG